jgi:hypothetical protein
MSDSCCGGSAESERAKTSSVLPLQASEQGKQRVAETSTNERCNDTSVKGGQSGCGCISTGV